MSEQKTLDPGDNYTYLLKEVRKSTRMYIRVMLIRYNGKVRVHIREFFTDEAGDIRPSRRGLSLGIESAIKLFSGDEKVTEELSYYHKYKKVKHKNKLVKQ